MFCLYFNKPNKQVFILDIELISNRLYIQTFLNKHDACDSTLQIPQSEQI